MKTKLITAICVVAISMACVTPCHAEDDDAVKITADALVVRPACFVATVLGAAIFVIGLPIAATSRSVKKTAHILVVKPARATFTRPLGDMDALKE
jgi:hypothetical protein